MSARKLEFTGQSTLRDPRLAVAEGLSQAVNALVAAGGAPPHLTAMTWTVSDPGAFHPARHVIDMACREVMGGMRPPIALRQGTDHSFACRAQATIPAPPAAPSPIWNGYAAPELARQYSPRGQVPDMQALFRQWDADGAMFRSHHYGLDLAYGPSIFETLDVYRPPNATRPPLWVYIHGGYWQASDKLHVAQYMGGMLDAGFAVANVNYGLCPQTPLARIAEQVRAALIFLVREADQLGFDAQSVHVAGHSAGGHLAAMLASDTGTPPVRSALLLSGLFDLTPLTLLPVGKLIGLADEATTRRLSPLSARPRPGVRIGVAVGGLESEEFKWQSRRIAENWRSEPVLTVAGANHFTLLDGLNRGELRDYAQLIAGAVS